MLRVTGVTSHNLKVHSAVKPSELLREKGGKRGLREQITRTHRGREKDASTRGRTRRDKAIGRNIGGGEGSN